MLKALGRNCPISLPHQLLLLTSVELLHIYRRLRDRERSATPKGLQLYPTRYKHWRYFIETVLQAIKQQVVLRPLL